MTATFDTLTPEQCLHARELLGWPLWRLAEEAGLRADTIDLLERGLGPIPAGYLPTIAHALESAGIEFIPGGARMREERSPEEAILPVAERKAS